jgi:pimeloyl-ACP methyl ester carboxylesterase
MIYWPEEFCDRLADRGFRVIRFDNRDVGMSSVLDHLGVPRLGPTVVSTLFGRPVDAPYALEDMAEDAALLLDALDVDRAHVVGASLGGMIAQTMAIEHPERMRSLTSVMSTTGEPGHYITEPRALKALLGPPPASEEEAMQHAVELFHVIGSPGFDRDEDALRERAALAWRRGSHPRGFLRQFGAMGKTGDRTARLRHVRTPTLVVHGTHDPLIRPIGGRLTARAIDGARLCMIDGMAHDLPQGTYGLITRLIENHAHEAARGGRPG